MLQILNWMSLISICFLCLQVFLYMCKNAVDIFEEIKVVNKNKTLVHINRDISNGSNGLMNKIAK